MSIKDRHSIAAALWCYVTTAITFFHIPVQSPGRPTLPFTLGQAQQRERAASDRGYVVCGQGSGHVCFSLTYLLYASSVLWKENLGCLTEPRKRTGRNSIPPLLPIHHFNVFSYIRRANQSSSWWKSAKAKYKFIEWTLIRKSPNHYVSIVMAWRNPSRCVINT